MLDLISKQFTKIYHVFNITITVLLKINIIQIFFILLTVHLVFVINISIIYIPVITHFYIIKIKILLK